MKYLILAVLTIQIISLYSQTYISPFIGIDLLDMQSKQVKPDYYNYEIYESRFASESIPIGVELEHQITNKFSVVGNISYSLKKVKASIIGSIAWEGFRFNVLNNILRFQTKVNNSITIGLGYNYTILSNFRYGFDDTSDYVFLEKKISHGPSFSIGYFYKSLKFTTYFNKGLNENLDETGLNMHPLNSVGLNIAYRFKVLDSHKNNKGEDCPKF